MDEDKDDATSLLAALVRSLLLDNDISELVAESVRAMPTNKAMQAYANISQALADTEPSSVASGTSVDSLLNTIALRYEPMDILKAAIKDSCEKLEYRNLTPSYIDLTEFIRLRTSMGLPDDQLLPSLAPRRCGINDRNPLGIKIVRGNGDLVGLLIARHLKLANASLEFALGFDQLCFCEGADGSSYTFSDTARLLSDRISSSVAIVGGAWLVDQVRDPDVEWCVTRLLYAATLGCWNVANICAFYKVVEKVGAASTDCRPPNLVRVRMPDGLERDCEFRFISAEELHDSFSITRMSESQRASFFDRVTQFEACAGQRPN